MYPPPTDDEFLAIERATTYPVPQALRRAYLRYGNGGFGPEYGFLGLVAGHATDQEDTALMLYEQFSAPDEDDPGWSWPWNLLPLVHIGCSVHLCVDLAHPQNEIVRFDPNGLGPGDDWSAAFTLEAASLVAWLTELGLGT